MNINELADKNGARVFEFFDRPIDWWFIKRLRKKLGMSQSYFARVLGVTRECVAGWESGKNKPNKPTQILLYVIDKDPKILKHIFYDSAFSITYKGEWQ